MRMYMCVHVCVYSACPTRNKIVGATTKANHTNLYTQNLALRCPKYAKRPKIDPRPGSGGLGESFTFLSSAAGNAHIFADKIYIVC